MRKQTTITRPPLEETEEESLPILSEPQRQEALLKLIRKGAPSVPQIDKEKEGSEKQVKYTLRISSNLSERVKRAAEGRPVKTPMNTWIVEAVLERLKKESH
jgi:hypothetical protein